MISGESAALAWGVLAVLVAAYVVAYDLWAHYTGHRTMTAGFHDALLSPVLGPIIVGLWVGLFIGLTFHFVIRK